MKNKDQITTKELAKQLNLSTIAIEESISKLKTEGRIERIVGDKGGHRKVFEKWGDIAKYFGTVTL